jgi:ABC-type antimicrobial peptide transport system permease subunit
VRSLDPLLPVSKLEPMDAITSRALAGERFDALLLGVFGLTALLLASVGLYGVMAFLVSQRTREIGIRVALGARPRDVMAMVLREGTALSAAGIAIGLPLSALLGATLSSVLYDVKPLDPLVFSLAPALLAVAALTATWFPARRATRVTPLTALRTE